MLETQKFDAEKVWKSYSFTELLPCRRACSLHPNYLGHVYIAKNLKSLRKVYLILDELAYEIKKKIPENTIFLIVSDHGMKSELDGTGNHSSHAFYSVNIETDWKPKDITDFYPKIIEWLET